MKPNLSLIAVSGILPGRDLPGQALSNARLATLMRDVSGVLQERAAQRSKPAPPLPLSSPDFPEQRIGIRSRLVLDESLDVEDLAVAAGRAALQRSGLSATAITAVVVTTVTAARVVPAIATTLQHRLQLPQHIPAFDLRIGCNGFLASLDVASKMLADAPEGAAILVVAAETMVRVLDAADRGSCPIFGDGAGAAVLARTERSGMRPVHSVTIGERGKHIEIISPDDGDRRPVFRFVATDQGVTVREDLRCARRVRMDGRTVFKDMVRLVPEFIAGYLDSQRLQVDDVDCFVMHQANARMIDAIARSLRLPAEKVASNIAEIGNTSSASIPLLLSEIERNGCVGAGQRVMLVGFGSGYSMASTVIDW